MLLLQKNGSLGLTRNFLVILFLLGLCLRFVVFIGPHRERDELIYINLVEQLDSGNHYSLQGSHLIEQGIIDRNQYNKQIFFHPPGGIVLFWLFYRMLGHWGYPLVQVFSYVLFFWSMVLLASLLDLSSSDTMLFIVAGLSAFSPIMAHVSTHYWLDGPLLGFATLAAAVFIWAVVRESLLWACIAGVLLGYATLIKVTAFLVIPGVAVLAWSLLKPPKRGSFFRLLACLLVPAIVVQLPWEIWQWIKLGTPFPGWAGKPSDSLVESNSYIHYVTVTRSPWIYLSLLPRILCTLVPSILLYVLILDTKTVRWFGLSFITWIFIVLSFHITLGFVGYSKLMRYVILITPASTLLFSSVMAEAIRTLRLCKTVSYRKMLTAVLITISVLSFFMEIAAGVKSSILYNSALMYPLFGRL